MKPVQCSFLLSIILCFAGGLAGNSPVDRSESLKLVSNDFELARNSKVIWVSGGHVVTDICGMQRDTIDFSWFREVDIKVTCVVFSNIGEERKATTACACIHQERNNTINKKLWISCAFR